MRRSSVSLSRNSAFVRVFNFRPRENWGDRKHLGEGEGGGGETRYSSPPSPSPKLLHSPQFSHDQKSKNRRETLATQAIE